MSFEESLQDVAIRERQLETHLLRSKEYLRLADQTLKRQVSMLYLAISLLLVFQGLFTFKATLSPLNYALLTGITSCLAIINCVLLIQTKLCLRRLNPDWLKPEEKVAIDALKSQRHEILTRLPRSRDDAKNAELN